MKKANPKVGQGKDRAKGESTAFKGVTRGLAVNRCVCGTIHFAFNSIAVKTT